MANPEHVEILKQGVEVWNRWRRKHPDIVPDLSEADLNGANLSGANLSETNLRLANLRWTDLGEADLKLADLRRADLSEANLREAVLNGANLKGADLTEVNLRWTDLSGAHISEAVLKDADLTEAQLIGTDLSYSTLVDTDLSNATLSDCNIYGISAWDLDLDVIKEQKSFRVTPDDQPAVYVDNLLVAQFVYLLLHNPNIRGIIDTIGEKAVLILGRFTPERKAILDAIRDKLRELGFVPMMFDFEKLTQRDFTETIKTLAGMSRFIIADITNPKSAPLELQAILPHYMIPMVPILQEDEKPFAMFRDLDQKYRQWVLPRLEYDTPDSLIKAMDKAIVNRALKLADELQVIKAQERQAEHVKDYL